MHSCLKRETVVALKAVLSLTGTHFLAQTTKKSRRPLSRSYSAQLQDRSYFPGHRPCSVFSEWAGMDLTGGTCCAKMLLCIKTKTDFSTTNKGQFV